MPSVSPLATEMLTCCTALTMPRRVANSTVRSLTSSSGGAVMMAASAHEVRPLAPRQVRCLSPQAGRGEGWIDALMHLSSSRPSLRIDDVAQAVAEQVETE